VTLRVAAEARFERRGQQRAPARVDELDEPQQPKPRAVAAEREPELAMKRPAQLARMGTHQTRPFTSIELGLL
jgi:hypothetical protein